VLRLKLRGIMSDAKKWRALVLVGVVIVLAIIGLTAPAGAWLDVLARPEAWHGLEGIALFVVVYVVWNCALPPAPLQALAGVYYGLSGGLGVIIVSTSVANAISHGFARWLGRDWFAQKIDEMPRLAALETAVERMGWRGVALLRLSNLIPSNIANLLMGVTCLKLPTILWASIVGSLPGWALMLTLGRSGLALFGDDEFGATEWTIYLVSAAAAVMLLVGLGWYARKVLDEPLADGE
jgi:uncharacterized membrane protein YdjX (TVP38/TMEM64 family)